MTSEAGTEMAAVALDLARNGVHVLPLVGKQPDGVLAPHGVNDATADRERIRRWFDGRVGRNVGIAIGVGALASVRVFDTDPRSGGAASRRHLVAEHGPLPATLTVRSGRGDGGTHEYFAFPAGEYRTKVAAGIDLLGPGRYVVAPGSTHPETGGRYALVADVGIAPAPRWLVQLARRRPVPPATSRRLSAMTGSTVERARRYLAKCEPAISGAHGHTTTFLTAMRLVRGFMLDEEAAYALLASEWNPRCVPPWSAPELRRKIREAAAVGAMDSGALLVRRWSQP